MLEIRERLTCAALAHGVVIKTTYRLQSFESLTRAARSFSTMVCSHGCWQKSSVPSHVDLFKGLLESLYDTAVGFPQRQSSKSEPGGSCEDRLLKVTHRHFCIFYLLEVNPWVRPTLKRGKSKHCGYLLKPQQSVESVIWCCVFSLLVSCYFDT